MLGAQPSVACGPAEPGPRRGQDIVLVDELCGEIAAVAQMLLQSRTLGAKVLMLSNSGEVEHGQSSLSVP